MFADRNLTSEQQKSNKTRICICCREYDSNINSSSSNYNAPAAGKFVPQQDTREIVMEGRAVNSASGVAETILLNANPTPSNYNNNNNNNANSNTAGANAGGYGFPPTNRPITNTSKTTNSQMEALKRIQESKRRNSMFVKSTTGGSDFNSNNNNSTNIAVAPRKVMNYAQFSSES